MSRRARRRKANSGNHWVGKTLLAIAAIFLIAIGVGYASLRHYLHSESFRQFLSTKAGDALEVTGSFAPFRWDGLAVDTSGFKGSGESRVRQLEIDRLHTEVRLAGVRRGVWELHGSRADRVEVDIDLLPGPEEEPKSDSPSKSPPRERKSRWLPDQVELRGLEITDLRTRLHLPQGTAHATGMRVLLEDEDPPTRRLQIEGGTVRLPFEKVPELKLDRVLLRHQDDSVFITEAHARLLDSARVSFTGEWESRTKRHIFEGTLAGVSCEYFLNEDWARRVTGDISSSFVIDGHSRTPSAHGSLTLENGTLTALPVLDTLAAYADTRRFRVLTLSEAKTDWRKEGDDLFLTHIILASENLVRLEGEMTIRDRDIDGSFRLGISPGTLTAIPGAETLVFVVGEKGLLWTSFRLTGTLDKPREDLSERLMAAAGLRMFEQLPESGERVLRFTRSVVGDHPSKTLQRGLDQLEKGVEALDRSSDIVRDAGQLIDGILGGGRRKERSSD